MQEPSALSPSSSKPLAIKTHRFGSNMINFSKRKCLETNHGIKKKPKHWIVNNVNNLCHILIMIYGQQSAVLKLAAKAEIQ